MARRAWVCRHGQAAPTVPGWTSRAGWIEAVREWAESPAFRALRAPIGAATLVAIAVVWAGFADHATGRNAAVTRARIAAIMGCDVRTITRAWAALRAAGFAVEVRRGHGSSSTPSAGNRPSIHHLISRRAEHAPAADPVQNVHLPPSGGSSSLRLVENYSPSARTRAPEHGPAQCFKAARRRWRATPRPLALQRLAGQLAARAHGLDHGHIGAICDAITAAGIDPAIWSAQALRDALDADMRATGRSWPDTIERPGAFLAWRLRRLRTTSAGQPPGSGGTATDPHQNEPTPAARPPQYVTRAPLVLTDAQQARIETAKAAIRQHFADRRQQRAAASGGPDTAPPRHHASARASIGQPTPETAQVCVVCGGPDPIRRPYLPTRRAHMCDKCWDVFIRPDQTSWAAVG